MPWQISARAGFIHGVLDLLLSSERYDVSILQGYPY